MKKQLIGVMFVLAISLVISAGQTSAQSEEFRPIVQFDFSASNTTIPAGTYFLNPVTDNRLVWRVRGTDQTPGTLLMASPSRAEEPGDIRITSRRHGERYFLTGFKTFYPCPLARRTSGGLRESISQN
jgi:hypothetical protein